MSDLSTSSTPLPLFVMPISSSPSEIIGGTVGNMDFGSQMDPRYQELF